MNSLSAEDSRSSAFLEAAGNIARRICRDAVWAAEACTWLEWTTRSDSSTPDIVYATVGSELYGGTSGIALFLARYLQVCSAQDRAGSHLDRVLRGAAQHALAGLAEMPASQPGFYDGAAGICYAVLEAGLALGDQQLVEQGLRQLETRATDKLADTDLDVIDGRAGLIPVLLDAAGRFGREVLLQSAVRQGDQLLQFAEKSAAGWSWPTMPDCAERNATGFAHGTAGIATALLELHHQTGEKRFLTGASEAWRYERTYFCRHQNNWPDFRYLESEPAVPSSDVRETASSSNALTLDGASASGAAQDPNIDCATAWCHGAVGIGLSRLRAWELGYQDEQLGDEIESALAATRTWFELHRHAPTDFSLCHGMAGNAELFLTAGETLKRPDCAQFAIDVGETGLQLFEQPGQPWPCGGTRVGETPNLMLGLAGIGMFYLRLHAPARIDTPLLVRPASRPVSDF